MRDLHVRRATLQDQSVLFDLWQEQHTINAQLDPRLTLLTPDPDAWQAALAQLLAAPPATAALFVAQRDQRLLGFIHTAYTSAAIGRIHDLVVDAHHGSGGVGTVLLDAALGWLREYRVRDVVVERVPHHIAIQQTFWRAKKTSVIQETRYLVIPQPDEAD
jgi:GNAT superfamily N-acetyltransferase